MQEPLEAQNDRNSEESLPSCARVLKMEGKEVFLLGTAHVSHQSVEDVRKTIEMVRPDAVCVELCQSRYNNIINLEQWKKTDIVKVIREGKAMLLLASLLMSSFQKRIGKQLGITPGAEMIEGIRQAEERGARLILADRDIQITLKRTWARLNLKSKLQMTLQLLASLFVVDKIDASTIEDLRKEDQLKDMLQMLAAEFPRLKGTLIDERDTYLAQKIRDAEGTRVVAVVGAGHVPGILREIGRHSALQPLEALPKPSILPGILQWSLPGLIVALFVYGFYRGGLQHSIESIYIWILVNGALSALGAALAFGHPVTVASAFVAAPLTSLNPMIAAGWVSGLVQAIVKKPTVENLEDLPEAILTVRGFWRNPVSRVLLVVILSNLGSSLGTFISGGWIAARSLT